MTAQDGEFLTVAALAATAQWDKKPEVLSKQLLRLFKAVGDEAGTHDFFPCHLLEFLLSSFVPHARNLTCCLLPVSFPCEVACQSQRRCFVVPMRHSTITKMMLTKILLTPCPECHQETIRVPILRAPLTMKRSVVTGSPGRVPQV